MMHGRHVAAHARPRLRAAESPVEAVPAPRRTLRVTTVGLCLLATVVLFGLVGFQALIVSNQSTIDELDGRIASATRTNQRLRLDVAELEAPERVRLIAIARLGMVVPETVTYLEPIPAEELGPAGAAAS